MLGFQIKTRVQRFWEAQKNILEADQIASKNANAMRSGGPTSGQWQRRRERRRGKGWLAGWLAGW
jgi:hypothetical protein